MTELADYSDLSTVYSHATDHIITGGKGSELYTTEGKTLLDFTSGIGVNSTGHCHPRVIAAIKEQADKLIFAQINIVYNEPVAKLCAQLKRVMPEALDTYFFSNSGAEAVEGAVKLAKHASGKPNIIVLHGSFHGRTHLTMAMTTSKTVYRLKYPNLPAGIYVAPYPYAYASGRTEEEETAYALAELELLLSTQTAPEETAAIVVEPVLGEGGYLPASKGYLQGLRDLCDKHGIMMICDEVQTGFGRTGKMFAHTYDDVTPDIMTMAKGLGSGMPISGIAYKAELGKKWITGTHGGTYACNPMAAAAAAATIETLIDEKLVENAMERGAQLMAGLKALQKKYPCIGDVRGRGLMIGIELMDGERPDTALPGKILKEVYQRNLLLLSCGMRRNVLRCIPPLVVTEEEIERGLKIIEEALEAVACI
ncbi:aspartate aminotransferase family protein [Pontiella agarivorans]|uniref:Aspartate aminotransferase family protein n=1 Tax=Pontiella agarivorans TaxID=3038953 RepID=A0ABU5MXQ7_9BACT|nr:aspartate aminotransferase family protein [Pontiella agarivorans]MDZ8118970.1 aspartate aminotransferase family protein [Pontiella agarivorans]